METNWAAEHLQIIRTLMERSALYRRALAPIMLVVGSLGVAAAVAGLTLRLDTLREFGALWLGTAVAGVAGALLIARKQALKDHEAFWSPPTRRVGHAITPPLLAGMSLGLVFVYVELFNAVALTIVWVLFYGCALHAAGFFMPRGMRLFGWTFIGMACVLLGLVAAGHRELDISAHWVMGFFFGALHLGYGAYLYLTEKGKNAA